jgi:hypothetical protein
VTFLLRASVLYAIRVIMVGIRNGREEGKKFGLFGHHDRCYVRMKGNSVVICETGHDAPPGAMHESNPTLR